MDYGKAATQGLIVGTVVSLISVVVGIPAAYFGSQNIFTSQLMRGTIAATSILLGPFMLAAAAYMRMRNGPAHFFGMFPVSLSTAWYNIFRLYFEDADVAAFKQIVEQRFQLKTLGAPGTINEEFLEKARAVASIENEAKWTAAIQELSTTQKNGQRVSESMFGVSV